MNRYKSSLLIFCLANLLLLAGCQKNEPSTAFGNINSWMYQKMDYWYYWTTELPKKPESNIAPDLFFKSLLFKDDRFSFIYENYEELVDLLNGVSMESGFEYKLYLEEPGGENVIMQIIYLKDGSPADLLGLKRGDIIYSINGQQITSSNYRELTALTETEYTAAYRRYNDLTETFDNQDTVTIIPTVFAEDPVLLDTIYEISGKKIGYFIYTFFSPGPSETSNTYDQNMDLVFSRFKNEGITDFILDLRFNSGGSEISAKNLASLIASNADGNTLMFKKKYNDNVQDLILNDKDLGEAFLNPTFYNKDENIGNQIGGTVHVITSNRSASASEVVINSLKPYMDVYLVGDTTVGKDVGSITLHEEDNAANNWAIQPIVVKIVNADNEDYPMGFYPNVSVKDNGLVLVPLGHTEEPLLNAALAAIGVTTARTTTEQKIPAENLIFESITKKAMSGKFILERR